MAAASSSWASVVAAVALLADSGHRLRHFLAAAIPFVFIAASFMTWLSWEKGRFAYGDVGSLNYVWFVNHSVEWPQRWPQAPGW